MPFDFKKFDAKCAAMSIEELQREWDHYTRLISGSATSTAVSGAAIPFTLGVSVIGVGLAAPAIHNARKKREIIEKHLQTHGTTHHTRKRDVLAPMAISGTVGLVTLGVGSMGADAITNAAVEHGVSSVAANEIAVKATVHLAVDGVAMTGEEHHMKQKRIADAHEALLKQRQASVGQTEKVGCDVTGSYNPSTYGKPTQEATNEKMPMDVKYEYNSVMVAPPMPPPTPLPLYSPPDPKHQDYFQYPQQYSEQANFHASPATPPPPPHTFGKMESSSQSAPVVVHEQPQQLPAPDAGYSQMHLHQSNNSALSTGNETYNARVSANEHIPNQAETSARPDLTRSDATYPLPLVQQTPQLIHPSYPGSTMPNYPNPNHDSLEQGMGNLSIATTQNQTIASPAQTVHQHYPASPQPSHQDVSYFPPPPPSPSFSSASSMRQSSVSSVFSSAQTLSPQNTRSSSISSYSSYSLPQENKPTVFSGRGYATPAPSSASPAPQTHAEQYHQYHQYHSPYLSPASLQTTGPSASQYANGYPTPAQTPAFSPPASQHNYYQSPPQSSYFPPPSQTPSHNHYQEKAQSPPYTQGTRNSAYGYPTPTATPSYNANTGNGAMYFPPPPVQQR